MKSEQAERGESARDIAFRWGVVAVILAAVGTLAYNFFADEEPVDLGTATTQVAPQHLHIGVASS